MDLQFPFTTAAGVSVTSLELRRLKVKDLKAIGKQAGSDEVLLEVLGVSRMCNIIPEDLDEMDAADYQKVKARFLEYVGITPASSVGDGATGEMVPVSAE
ncbi:phage tail assembly protein [Undibacterium sp. 14-3-2]|uniref:phage tail assembly protein n=1 Tax=Undibacterium sp. 14-3-2 TaxID=2800129 RepID=UPI001F390FC1|nr:phage tail assembly protein [Undibacterium sp. 14-3-2]